MLAFWRYGYEATSIADLTASMGITPPSLYSAFGDKKRLFLEAVDLYMSGPVTSEGIFREAATAREAVETLLHAAAVGNTQEGEVPPGCMLVSSATNCSADAADVQAAVATIRRRIEAALAAKIQTDVDAGLLGECADASALASLYMAITQGMSTQARDGATTARLLAMADVAMRAWPDSPTRRHKGSPAPSRPPRRTGPLA